MIINDCVKLITGSHDIHSPTYEHKFAPICVEDFAWIATDALVLQGVTVGKGAVVSAGAVVTKSVSPFTVVGGNPAREIATRTAQILLNAGDSDWVLEKLFSRLSEKVLHLAMSELSPRTNEWLFLRPRIA